MDQQMPVEMKDRLCDCLMRFETMRDPDTRNLYVAELDKQLGQPLNIRRFSDPRHDVWSLVSACLDRPGALPALAQIIRGFHRDSAPMADFEHLVAEVERVKLMTSAEREALIQLLAKAPRHRIIAVHRSLIDPVPGEPAPNWSDARSVLRSVEASADDGAGVALLLRFVDGLAHGCSVGVSRELHQWIECLAGRIGCAQQDIRTICIESRRMFDEAPSARPLPSGSRGGGDASEDLPRIWGGIPVRNPNFIGREALLLHLNRALEQHAKASVLPQTLHGLGGVGKTQLAVEYVYRSAEQYNLVWWIPAERPTDILASLAVLGERLGLPPSQDKQQNARTVLDALSTSRYHWLLVYDNADRPEDIGTLVPSVGGHVILTSRNPQWATRWNTIEVDVFERDESIELLRKRGTDISTGDADQLAEKLGDLPLALEQAVNFQLATGMPVREYLSLFDERVQELLSEGKPTDYPTTVAAFLGLAFDRLRKEAPVAAELLDLFAHLGPDAISANLLRRGRSADVAPPLKRALRDPILMNRMIRDLPRYGLAKVDLRGQRVQVHRLVQSVLRSSLDDERRAQSLDNVRKILEAANPGFSDDPETWLVHAEIGPHILPADMIHAQSPEARLVALEQARYLFQIGDYASSKALGEIMVVDWSRPPDEGGLGHDHGHTLLAHRHLANALRMLGDYARARALDERAFELLRTNPAFGDNHEHTVEVALGLGFDLNVAGDLRASLDSDKENVARAIRVYGEFHEITLRAKNNVASGMRATGDFAGAHDISLEVVEAFKEILGEYDYRTPWAINERVYGLLGLGRYTEALDIQERALERLVQIHRPGHREVLLATRNVAIALRKTGDHARALSCAQDNHEAFAAAFGKDHEFTLAAMMTNANSLRAAGRLAEARGVAEDAVQGYRERFGARHRLTLAAQVNQGIILRLLGERREASDLERCALAALREVLGDEHPYTLCAANNYASSLALDHKVSQARELTGQTLALSTRVRGASHPDTLACALNAAFDLQATEGEQAGQPALAEAMRAMERVLGPEHPDTVDAGRGKRAECDIEPAPI